MSIFIVDDQSALFFLLLFIYLLCYLIPIVKQQCQWLYHSVIYMVIILFNHHSQTKNGLFYTGKNPTYAQAKIKLFARNTVILLKAAFCCFCCLRVK